MRTWHGVTGRAGRVIGVMLLWVLAVALLCPWASTSLAARGVRGPPAGVDLYVDGAVLSLKP